LRVRNNINLFTLQENTPSIVGFFMLNFVLYTPYKNSLVLARILIIYLWYFNGEIFKCSINTLPGYTIVAHRLKLPLPLPILAFLDL
jgi:hypothetical protein